MGVDQIPFMNGHCSRPYSLTGCQLDTSLSFFVMWTFLTWKLGSSTPGRERVGQQDGSHNVMYQDHISGIPWTLLFSAAKKKVTRYSPLTREPTAYSNLLRKPPSLWEINNPECQPARLDLQDTRVLSLVPVPGANSVTFVTIDP